MSNTALQRAGANLEQPDEADTAWAPVPANDGGLTIEELDAAFAMFGVKSEQPDFIGGALMLAGRSLVTVNRTLRAPDFAFPSLKQRVLHIEQAHAMKLFPAVDWIVVALAAEFAARWGGGGSLLSLSLGEAFCFLLGALAIKAGLWLTDVYRATPATLRAESGAGGVALGALLGLAVANFIAPDARSAAALAAIVPAACIVLAAIHAAFAVWIRAAHKKGVFAENIVLVGATEAAHRMAARASKSGEARIVAVVDDRLARSPSHIAGAPMSGNLDDLLAWEHLPHVDRIVITVTQKAEARVRAMIERLRVAPNRVDLLLDYPTESVKGRKLDKLSGAGLLCVSGRPHNAQRALIKRAQDLVIGSLLCIAFAPVMAAIAVAVKLDSRGPALYRQRRHGFNNRVITVLKFRTMRHDPGAPMRQVTAHDPRVTRLGGFLRRTSLDELPQLFNVLMGEMSLVGPRPHAIGMRTAERDLSHIVAEYAHRHRVKPGMTGWAQVNGSRGPLETPAMVRQRLKYDLEYITRASLWLDLKIMLRTAPALLGDYKATR